MLQVISMGNAACGKSCLIKRYCEEKVRPADVQGFSWVSAAGQALQPTLMISTSRTPENCCCRIANVIVCYPTPW